MMRQNDCIVVTGAGGLVGSAVVEHLRSQRQTCVIGLRREDCDLQDFDATEKLFMRIRPSYVFHAAALVFGIVGNMTNQARSFLENTRINTSVVSASHLAGVKKIVVMGTNSIYPWPSKLPYDESAIFDGRPHADESAYGHAKRGMLAMLEAYESSYGTRWVYLVSGNLFGPRDRFDPVNGHVIPSLIWKFYEALTDDSKLVELFGDGTPERDFLYVKDLARVSHLVMSDDGAHGAINVGHGERWSIAQVAEALCRITGVSERRVRWNSDKPNGRPCCAANLDRLHDLGFKATYSLEQGLNETWNWYRDSKKVKRLAEVDWALQTR